VNTSTAARARRRWWGWGVVTGAFAAAIVLVAGQVVGADLIIAAVATWVAFVVVGVAASTRPDWLRHVDRLVEWSFVAAGMTLFVGATFALVVIGFGGGLDEGERDVLGRSIVAGVLVLALGGTIRRGLARRAREVVRPHDEVGIDALRSVSANMTRSIPLGELLLQLAEAVHAVAGVERVEVWTGEDGRFELAASVPARRRDPIVMPDETAAIAARAKVQGDGWLGVWIPTLVDDRADVRFVPAAHRGELLGFIVVERGEEQVVLDEDIEHHQLLELGRRLGLALHNSRLDSALRSSLDDLRDTNRELAASRTRIVSAADESRRRLERDLHDGAQQHLVTAAIKVGLIQQLLDDREAAEELIDEIRTDVQTALAELRELAHGVYPPSLRDRGLVEALRAAAGRSALPTVVSAGAVGRFDPDIESAVYFCCLEAIQNAVKYAGDDATICIELTADDRALTFAVADDGDGFDPGVAGAGAGFVNMRDRLGAFDGRLSVESAPGQGARIVGTVPLG
jgi:signal transduction histidine kinase